MSRRGPMKVSGLVSQGKVVQRPLEPREPDSSTQETPSDNLGVMTPTPALNLVPNGFVPDGGASEPAAATEQVGTTAPTKAVAINGSVQDLPVEAIVIDPRYQTRMRLNESHVDDLMKTIRTTGLGEPIKVRWVDGRYELLRGHHRLEANKRLNLKTVRAAVHVMTDAEALRDAMLGNGSRLDEYDYERALNYKRYLDYGFANSQAEVAEAFGITQGRVSQVSSMLDLPLSIRQILDKYPNLLSYRGAMTIRTLLKQHPEHEEIVIKAVERLIDVADEAELKKEEFSLKQWIEQMIHLQQRGSQGASVTPHVIARGDGTIRFQTKTKGRQIIVDLKDTSDDTTEIERLLHEALKGIPEQGSGEA